MEGPQACSISIPGAYRQEAVCAAAQAIRQALGRPARFAVAFVSQDYVPFLQEFSETLRVDGHITNLIGCTCLGRIEASEEVEQQPGCVVLALDCDAGEPVIPDAGGGFASPISGRPHGALLIGNPFTFPTEGWLRGWNRDYPGAPCLGGLASGASQNQTEVFYNGRIVDAVCVPLCGKTGILPLISQGCRPIGEPLTVTRAEHNIIYSLGGQPAYKALESAFETLTDSEKSHAKGNLLAGIAGTEYVEDFKSGDFLIRSILGADPGSGTVAIGGNLRTGQTLQYQLRARTIAQTDLARVLASPELAVTRPFAGLLFSSIGRGASFFGEPNCDAAQFHRAIGGSPLAGFFSNGEIGPAGGRNGVHSYTAAAAIWIGNPS